MSMRNTAIDPSNPARALSVAKETNECGSACVGEHRAHYERAVWQRPRLGYERLLGGFFHEGNPSLDDLVHTLVIAYLIRTGPNDDVKPLRLIAASKLEQ